MARDSTTLLMQLEQNHRQLREALTVTGAALSAQARPATEEELALCRGLCWLLTDHLAAQDQGLFPELHARHPDLGPILSELKRGHVGIARRVADVRAACDRRQPIDHLRSHVADLAHECDEHFPREEAQLQALLT